MFDGWIGLVQSRGDEQKLKFWQKNKHKKLVNEKKNLSNFYENLKNFNLIFKKLKIYV